MYKTAVYTLVNSNI